MGEWIEHDGGSCPVPGKTIVDMRFRGACYCGCRGDILLSVPADGGDVLGNCDWFHDGTADDIIAYRLHDDGSEAKTREARISNFRKIANDALIGDKPVKAPKKERV